MYIKCTPFFPHVCYGTIFAVLVHYYTVGTVGIFSVLEFYILYILVGR